MTRRIEPASSARSHSNRIARFVSILLIAGFGIARGETPDGSPSQWSKFQNGGVLSDSVKLPVEWTPDQNIAWTADIAGYGQSTPVVAHGQIVVTSTSGENKENYHVTAFATGDGKKLWQVDLSNPSPYKNTPMVSRAAPSAVASADGFVAFFEGGILIGVTPSGAVSWKRDLVKEYGKIEARHGLAASLESDKDRVYAWVERSEQPYVIAVAPETGETLWKSEGVGSTSWASPRLIPVGETSHLVCSASGKIVGFDPESGEKLWEFEGISNNSSCTPVPVRPGQFLIGASDGRGEASAGTGAVNNGLIQVQPDPKGGYKVDFAWNAKKATSTFGSPVVAGDTAAIVNRTGVLYRLSLENGETVSTDRTDAGGIWATPIVTKDYLYVFGYKGTTSVISLADGKEVATNRCWPEAGQGDKSPGFGGGDVLYAAAIADDKLLIRRGDRLYAIESP